MTSLVPVVIPSKFIFVPVAAWRIILRLASIIQVFRGIHTTSVSEIDSSTSELRRSGHGSQNFCNEQVITIIAKSPHKQNHINIKRKATKGW